MSEQTQPQSRRDIEAHFIAKAWKDNAYKQELLNNPKTLIEKELGVEFPQEVTVQVLEENPTTLYFVLPMRPEVPGQELSDAQLEAIAGGANLSLEKITAAVAGGTAAALSYAISLRL